MKTMTVLIKFLDGEEVIIEDADSYSTSFDSFNWKVEVKKNNLFFNKNEVKYIGRMEDLRPNMV